MAMAMAALPAWARAGRWRVLRRVLGAVLALAGAVATPAGIVPERFGPDDVVLIVAPHPDDETLCCAGVAQRARAAGAQVAIVWLTSGDAFELDAIVVEHRVHPGKAGLERLAHERMAEARAAAGLLGIGADSLFFLGYPDRGLQRLLGDRYFSSYRSRYTGADAVPYANALAPGAAYQGRNLARDLAAVLDRLRPTLVLAPTPLDAHPDHRAAGELVMRRRPFIRGGAFQCEASQRLEVATSATARTSASVSPILPRCLSNPASSAVRLSSSLQNAVSATARTREVAASDFSARTKVSPSISGIETSQSTTSNDASCARASARSAAPDSSTSAPATVSTIAARSRASPSSSTTSTRSPLSGCGSCMATRCALHVPALCLVIFGRSRGSEWTHLATRRAKMPRAADHPLAARNARKRRSRTEGSTGGISACCPESAMTFLIRSTYVTQPGHSARWCSNRACSSDGKAPSR